MTLETKYFLNLPDILAVHVECSGCHVSSSFPVSKLLHAPYECPHCHVDWLLPRTSEEKAISAFVASLNGATEALKGRSFKLSLEVKYDEEEDPSETPA